MEQTRHSAMALSFGSNATDYDRLRPSYPAEAVNAALAGITATDVLDLGAGTGLLTRLLVAPGRTVTAVEPGAGMREVFAAAVPSAVLMDGTAEAIPLPDESIDAVFVAQSFYWFNRPQSDLEIARVLRPGGVLAVLTNINPEDADWEAMLHQRVLQRPQPSLRRAADPLTESVFENETVTIIDNTHWLSREDFLRIPATWSWVATSDADIQEQVAREAASLADELVARGKDGRIEMPYRLRTVRAVRRH